MLVDAEDIPEFIGRATPLELVAAIEERLDAIEEDAGRGTVKLIDQIRDLLDALSGRTAAN